MAQQLGSAYGVIEIGTGKAHSNILGLNTAIGGLGASMLSLNPVTLGLTTAFVGLGAAVIGVGAGIGAITGTIASSVRAADQLETTLDGVQANMQITNEETAMLKELVSDLGLDPKLKVSSFEAAEAIEMLGRNGLEVEEILGGAARSTVLLANATGGTFSQSADIATDAMSLFGIEAEDMAGAVNGITSVVNNSKFDINDYALALAQGGGVAAGVGVEFEDFNTTIAGISQFFASGSDAGTSFKVMLQRLIPQSKNAADEMRKLGLFSGLTGKEFDKTTEKIEKIDKKIAALDPSSKSYEKQLKKLQNQRDDLSKSLVAGRNAFFDEQGNMKSMAEIAKELRFALADLSEERRNDALSTIFGTDAMRAAIGLMELGEEGFNDLQMAMRETDAEAAAATRMDNLSGDLEILQGVIETLRIEIGDLFIPVFRDMVQAFTGFVSGNADNIVDFFGVIADSLQYLWAVVEGGDTWNDWITHLPEAIRPAVMGLGEFVNVIVSTARHLLGMESDRQKAFGWMTDFPEWIKNAIGSLDEFSSAIIDAFNEGGFSGVFNEIWAQLFGADTGVISTGVDGIIESITSYLSTKWPELQGVLQGYADQFWLWLLGDGTDENQGALSHLSEGLDSITGIISEWVNDPATQTQLSEFGDTIGGIVYDGVSIAIGSQEKAETAMGKLSGALGGAALNLTGDFILVGGQVVAGIFAGIYSGITGNEYRASTIEEFRNLAQDIADALLEFGWEGIGGSILSKIIFGMTGVKIDPVMAGNFLDTTTDVLILPKGAAAFGRTLAGMNNVDLSGGISPGVPVSPVPSVASQYSPFERQTELLEAIDAKLKGQANFTVSEESLRNNGFIHSEDLPN